MVEYTIMRNTPVLSRAMKCKVRPADDRLHVFEIRIFDNYPEKGGKLIDTVKPKITLPPGWEKAFVAPMATMIKETCKECGSVFTKHPCASSKKRCDPCQKEKQRAYNLEHSKRWYAENGDRLKAERKKKKAELAARRAKK